MKSRRTFVFSFLLVFLLSVLMVTGGCGGGGGGSSKRSTPDIPEPVPEPQPEPEPEPEDTSQAEVEYALSYITIGYMNGDNPEYVTQDLTLPVKSEITEDIIITWTSSNPGVISSNGKVTRQAYDTEVTLTASAEKGTGNAEKRFQLTVIRQRSRTPEQAKAEIQINGVNEIRLMNLSNDEFRIKYSESRDRVTDIDGKYADFAIRTADDALDAVQSLHGILGINDPYEELEPSVITSDAYGAEYTFSQVHDGVHVFGRNVTVSANSADEGDFITSSIVPSLILDDSNLNFTYTKEQAENIAKTHYIGSYDVRKDMTEKVIFSLYGYDNNPVPAYSVNIYGNDDEGKELDDNIFVNAIDGNVIFATTNIYNADNVKYMTDDDELTDLTHKQRTFPVISLDILGRTYHIFTDPETNVEVYNREIGIFWGRYNHVSFGEHDEQQVSAYANMIDVMKWWRASFDRNSLDGKGMTVKVVTHAEGSPDNAAWNNGSEIINVYDALMNRRSYAAAVEVMAHESTHAVLRYRIDRYRGGIDNFPYVCSVDITTGDGPATGAINEGYADIFGCLMSGQWFNGLNVHANGAYDRNIRNPADGSAQQNIDTGILAPTRISEAWCDREDIRRHGLKDAWDHGGVHINSSLVSYPAYLMHQDNTPNGLTWNELAQLWYKSMRTGYSAVSSFRTVRTCVLRAARKLGMPRSKISVIEQAFEEVGITVENGTLKGTVSKYNGEVLSNVRISAKKYYTHFGTSQNERSYTALTDTNGIYSLNLEEGTYSVDVSVNGYVPFNAIVRIEEGNEYNLDIPLVARGGTSSLTGKVRDAQTGEALDGVLLKLFDGWNVHTGYTTAETLTQSDGTYSTHLVAGYYTAEFSKEGYITTSINNLVISSDEALTRDVILSRTTDNKYRVTLQWGDNPSDLDSHLTGELPEDTGGGTFHVFYANAAAGFYDGDYVAFLDHDDVSGNGFETITFQMQPGDTFRYYVHWYNGYGTWGGSNAVVNIYKSTELLATFPVPNVNLSGGYWHVFDITDGLDPVRPSEEVPIYYTAPSLP